MAAGLIERMAQDNAIPSNKHLSAHRFSAAIFLWAAGDFTRAEAIAALELEANDEIQLDQMVTFYNGLTSSKKREFHGKVEAVIILLQDGKITKAQAKTFLGMT